MRKYKQDLLFDLFDDDIFWKFEKEIELFENKELTETIEAAAKKLPKKQRIVFCLLIRCEKELDEAHHIFSERIEEIDIESFKTTMNRARRKVAKLTTDTPLINHLRDTVFKN